MEDMCILSEEKQYQQCNMSPEGNEALWKACAGPSADLPRLGEHVYYFPQGNWEQLDESSKVELDQNMSFRNLPPKICCQVSNLNLKAEKGTDEVYAQITLVPHNSVPELKSPQHLPDSPKPRFNSFSKVLAASDTNGHCRLHIRKKDAENCLPPLGTTEQMSTQLAAKDLYGNEWTFKHVFEGSPPRHLFTAGWSKFVTSKRLVPGDSFVFLRGENGELRVGVRRRIYESIVKPSLANPSDKAQVLSASYAMATGSLFTVIYRPRKSQFVVGLNKYLQAVKSNFSSGMIFKMQLKGEDSVEREYWTIHKLVISRFTWYILLMFSFFFFFSLFFPFPPLPFSWGLIRCIGKISGIEDISPRWKNSEWRNLKVQWDGSTCGTLPERVSSWEIEPVLAPPTSLVQIGGKKKRQMTFSPVSKRKSSKIEVQNKHMELRAMLEEPTQPPVASSEAIGEKFHDIPVTFPTEGCEILNLEEDVQGLNNAATYLDNNPATYGREVSSNYGITHSSSIKFPIEEGVGARKQFEGINITDISHAVRSGSSPTSEGSDTWLNSILQDDHEQVECQREAPPLRQQSQDPSVLPQGTSLTGLESFPMVTHISSIQTQIPFFGSGNSNELVNWEGYSVTPRCVPILDRITKRYPNTLSSFRLSTRTFQSVSLEMLAEVVITLERLTVENMNEERLDDVKRHLMDLKINGIDMHWLERRLEHIVRVTKKNVLAGRREELARKVDEASATIRQLKEELSSVDMELEKVSSLIDAEPLLSANHSVIRGLL